jgi:hypothetical protein
MLGGLRVGEPDAYMNTVRAVLKDYFVRTTTWASIGNTSPSSAT